MIQFETTDNNTTKAKASGDIAIILKYYALMVRSFSKIYDLLLFDSEKLKNVAGQDELKRFHKAFFETDDIISAIIGECVCSELLNIEEI